MYDKLSSMLHSMNIIFQALYSLVMPIGIGGFSSYLLTKYASAPKWIWAVLLTLGTLLGLYSMVKYILTAMKNLELLEKQRERAKAEAEEKARKQEELRRDLNKKENEGG